MYKRQIQDTDILGLALSEGAMLVNFAPSFETVGSGMDDTQERLLAYDMVNTLCAGTGANSVCFFRRGAQFELSLIHILQPGGYRRDS